MKSNRVAMCLSVTLVGMLAVFAGGCSKSLRNALLPNLEPSVQLTSAPYDTTGRYFYYYRLNWIGNDPDGRVDHFVYTTEYPRKPGDPVVWTGTTKNEQIIPFSATKPDSSNPRETRASDFHTFAIYAVDNRGAVSDTIKRSFFSYTVAPEVRIDSPQPNHLSGAYLTPSVRIHWTGSDPDGQLTQKPVRYKYKLLTTGGEFPIDVALLDADSVRRFYAPDFRGWSTISGDTTEIQFTNLTPDADYIFVVVGFDEAGAYSPLFSLDTNLLLFHVGFAATLGPGMTVYNEFFTYTYRSGGYIPSNEVELEVPFNQKITFNWFATPPTGADIESYRWKLGGDLSDETPRADENDWSHWSSRSRNTTSAVVGPFLRDTLLRFYIEATDNNNLTSLAVIRFTVVKPSFDRPLGIVEDTRLVPDSNLPGTNTLSLPAGAWPTKAELDTFLFARGGKPWKGYPAGTLSAPGVFAGYDFDTVGTRTGKLDLTVRLAVLGRFRHVIWVLDAKSALMARDGTDRNQPISSLRYMSIPNRQNTLATYIRQGGVTWCLGGGCAYATCIPFDRSNNGSSIFSAALGELTPGRFMWDVAHWRSEIRAYNGTYAIPRSDRAIVRPDYAMLPAEMRLKSAALGDAFPPGRTGQSAGIFYQSRFDFEYMSVDNRIIENLSGDPDILDEHSTLDTLYKVADTGGTPAPNPGTSGNETPIMTLYHGLEDTTFVMTGFPPWFFSRVDFVSLVDYVLHNVWGLARSAPMVAATPAVVAAGRVARPAVPGAVTPPQGSARTLVGGGKAAPRPGARLPLIDRRPRE